MSTRPYAVFFVLWAGFAVAMTLGCPATGECAADTLTVIQRPLLNVPALIVPGNTLSIACEAAPGTSGWAAELLRNEIHVPLQVISSTYDPTTLWWSVMATIPPVPVYDLYDLVVTANGGIADTTRHAVQVLPQFKDDYYFIHISDTHLPTELYYYESGADTDSSSMVDLREIIRDVNIINPEFVLLTGDFINEGELEDYLSKHYFTRAQALLGEFDVPVFLTSGNHDIGGWNDTPPPGGTARHNWWKFFGWERLDSPPPGAPSYTQDYSFDYGPVHYIGLEAYLNYESWRPSIYGGQSFRAAQMQWLANDMALAGSATHVLFYHSDFSNQVNLTNLGADMALSGHDHRDAGSISAPPYNLKTNNACNGERSYRLVRVSSGVLQPTATISAGSTGRNLNVVYSPANDGANYTVTANITNNIAQRFEHAHLRFLMPNEAGAVTVTGGTLLQIDDSGPLAVCYVGVDILPSSSATITVMLDPGSSVGPGRDPRRGVWLGPGCPNPCISSTSIGFGLPTEEHVRITVSDTQGRTVAVLVDRALSAGEHSIIWDGRDDEQRQVSPGIYFTRLAAGGQVRIQKILVAR